MDRLEQIRIKIDRLIQCHQNAEHRKFAYLHLYGTSQCATLLAIKRHLDQEICAVAAMLHDISLYAYNCPQKNHAHTSANYARKILMECELFDDTELQRIVMMIDAHSDKQKKSQDAYIELLKDADVLAHYLYNPKVPVAEYEQVRLYYILEQLS